MATRMLCTRLPLSAACSARPRPIVIPCSQMALDVFKEDPEIRKHEEEYQVGAGWMLGG